MSSRFIVFGTAGHVDHGKSALVRALTGTDPDRLAEEKAREMTIDLGFAFLDLPGLPHPVAIVDVPGHEMFVRNMVAGATGTDAAIFVVAADEGPKPQTAEHLEVLRQLRVPAGVIALTKCDKTSPERLAAAREEVAALVVGTFLEGAPMVPVSALTGVGLEDLRAALARLAAQAPTKPVQGPFRLPVDRSFTMKGAGTVVTGTVISGSLQVGARVSCLPENRLLRVRGLQVHNQAVSEVAAGQRAAINLAGIEKEEIERGDVLATPGAFAPSRRLDVRVTLAGDAARPLVSRTRVRVHHGTAEVMARIVLLEGEQVAPGESALAQLRLEAALVAAPGDPFVLRSYSPMHVIGGGVVVDPHPPKRRAGAEETAAREGADAMAAALQVLARAGDAGLLESELQVRCGLSEEELHEALEDLEEEGQALHGKRDRWFSGEAVQAMATALVTALEEYHRSQPRWAYAPLNAILARVAPRPEQRECWRLALERAAAAGTVAVVGERARLADHQPQWTPREAGLRDAALAELRRAGLAAPSPADLAAKLRIPEAECRGLLEAMADGGLVTTLTAEIFLHPEVLQESRDRVIGFLRRHGAMGIPEARELLGASRKYLLPFLEQLDREGVTARQGDVRRLRL